MKGRHVDTYMFEYENTISYLPRADRYLAYMEVYVLKLNFCQQICKHAHLRTAHDGMF